MKTIPYHEAPKEHLQCAIELLKQYDHGTPEFDLAISLINAYKSYMDSVKRNPTL